MAARGLKIGIIGGGISGLTAAIALCRRGAQVSVYEQASELGEVGAGIQLSANAIVVFDALGLNTAEALIHTRPFQVQLCEHQRARPVVSLPINDDLRVPFFQAHRADLISFLAESAAGMGIEIILGQRAERITTAEGTGIKTDKDSREFDIVIGADGVHSAVRSDVAPDIKPEFTGFIAYRALIGRDDLGDHPTLESTRVYMGPKAHIVAYPLRDGSVINLVAVQQQKEWVSEGWNHPLEQNDLVQKFRGWAPECLALLAAASDVHQWGLFSHPVLPRWSDGKTILIGDAAHSMLPFMAQGAAMGIEDAWVLAAEIDAYSNPRDALEAFENARKNRVTRVQKTARGNADIYHLSNSVVRPITHLGMRTLGAIAPSLMTRRYDWIYQEDVTQLKV